MSLIAPGSPYVEIPEAEHHVMIDQPLAFVAALQGAARGVAAASIPKDDPCSRLSETE